MKKKLKFQFKIFKQFFLQQGGQTDTIIYFLFILPLGLSSLEFTKLQQQPLATK